MSIKESIKNALILLAITVFAGLILGLIYENTKGIIADREAADKKNAYYEVFSGASDFVPVEGFMTDAERAALDSAGFDKVTIDELMQGLGGGLLVIQNGDRRTVNGIVMISFIFRDPEL